jgi:hypothetical protein
VALAPTGVESADRAAELTAALTLRMRPPPEPPADLRLSTGLWLALTAVGVSLWLYALLYNPAAGVYTAAIAAVEFLVGYAWVVYLDGRRGVLRGALALLPPVAVDRLLRPRTSQGYRPLRFVLTGAVLLGLVLLAPALRPTARTLAGLDAPPPPPPPAPVETPPAVKLRDAVAQKNDQLLIDELKALAEATDVRRTVTPPAAKAELVAALRELLRADAPEVRTAALSTLLAWIDDDAKPDVLAVLKSPTAPERRAALKACGRWKDAEVAAAVAARLAVRDDLYDARCALLEIGKDGGRPAVEEALLPLLATDDDNVLPEVQALTVQFGGERTVAGLKKLEAAAATPAGREKYRKWWQEVARTNGPRN